MIASQLTAEHVGMVVTVITDGDVRITDRVVGIYASLPPGPLGRVKEGGETRIEIAFEHVTQRGAVLNMYLSGFLIDPTSQVFVHEPDEGLADAEVPE